MFLREPTFLPALLLLALLGLGAAIYLPGLHGDFLFDDYANLPALGEYGGINDWHQALAYAFNGHAGPSGRPIALASFLLDDNAWPSEAFGFKRTNLLFHLLTGCLLAWCNFNLFRLLSQPPSRAAWSAAIGAGLWLLHPFFVSTVMYPVQRMTILAALFCVAGLTVYLHGRLLLAERRAQPWRAYAWMTAGVVLFTPLAVLSKENGALLPMLILAVHCCLPESPDGVPRPQRLWTLILLVLPSAAVAAYALWIVRDPTGAFAAREFSLNERLWSEARILLIYLRHLVIPEMESGGLYQDAFTISRGPFQPPTSLLSALVLAAMAAAVWRLRKRWPLAAMAVLFFFAGHFLESSVIPLELYFEHRNYLPSMLLFSVAGSALTSPALRISHRAMLASAALIVLSLLCWQRNVLWGRPMELYQYWAQTNPNSVRAQQTAALQWLQRGRADLALQVIDRALARMPGEPYLSIAHLSLSCTLGRESAQDVGAVASSVAKARYSVYLFRNVEAVVNGFIDRSCRRLSAEQARSVLDALERNPEFARRPDELAYPWYLRGRLVLASGDGAEAARWFTRAFEQGPRFEMGMQMVAELASAQHYREALALLGRVDQEFGAGASGVAGALRIGVFDDRKEIDRMRSQLQEDLRAQQ